MTPEPTPGRRGLPLRGLSAVFLAALLARGALLLAVNAPAASPDSADYINIANSLLSSGSYSLDGAAPDCTRPPGYPFFLAALNLPFGSVRTAPTQLAQAALDSAAAVLVALLALEFCAAPAALAAGAAYALHPVFAGFSRMLLSETLFMFLWLLFLLAARRAAASRGLALSAAAGAALAAAVLVRPAHMFYFAALAPIFFFLVKDWRRALLMWLLFAAVFYAGTAPWKARNRALFGKSMITTGAGVALWTGSRQDYPKIQDLYPVWPRGDFKSLEADAAFAAAAKANWSKDRLKLLLQMPHRLRKFWLTSHSGTFNLPALSEGAGAFFRAVKLGLFALQALLLLLAGAGAFLLRDKWRELLFLLLPAAYVSAHILNDWGPSRYHISALPGLFIVIAWGAARLGERLKEGCALKDIFSAATGVKK